MEKCSLVSAMGDSTGLSEPRPSARGGQQRQGQAAENVFEDGSEDFVARRRGGTPPIPAGAANSPRLPKPMSMIFAPPNTLARFHQSRGSPSSGDEPQCRLGMSITLPFVGEVRWKAVRAMAAECLRNPKNWAVGVWGIAVFVSGAMLFMVMVGMLNGVLPRKTDRDLWFEASNQTINALFTLFVLLLHPLRMLHLMWLLRWRRKDISKLRDVYCKGALPKPNEWLHMLVVLLLYQLNCFAQYAVCALNWYYDRAHRPVGAVMVCFVMALGAGCAAGIYTNMSPLGKHSSAGEDEAESLALEIAGKALPARFLHAPQKYDQLLERHSPLGGSRVLNVVENPQWQGGVFDCWEAPTLVAATACCFPCVLGHNLSRLEFGNRYVHVATFLLACFAPFVIFEMAAVNVDSRGFRQFLRGSGIIVSVCGLFYGGYWRIRMRETYGLPGETSCCGHSHLSDFAQWLLCSCCSLCQEVRTAEAFDISNSRFYVKAQSTALASAEPDNGRGEDPGDLEVLVAPPSSLQPLPVSSVVRINSNVLSKLCRIQ